MLHPIAITGIGTASGLGLSGKDFWRALCEGTSALGTPTIIDLSGFPCQLGAEIKGLSVKDCVPKAYRKFSKVMARDTEIAVVCAWHAFADARILTRATEGATPTYPGERMGCQIGAGLIAAETAELTKAFATATAERASCVVHQASGKSDGGQTPAFPPMPDARCPVPAPAFSYPLWGTIAQGETTEGIGIRGMDNLQPLWMLKFLPNMLACHVTILHGCEGPSNTITCAEASGLLSIGEACRVIERGAADACIAGSAESKLNHMGVARMTLIERLARCASGDNPADVVRPFDATSRGAAIGEGGGLLIVENAESAKARRIKPYAYITGFGASHAVSFDMTGAINAPHRDPKPLARAIKAALRDAKLSPADIDAVVPQGCGAPAVDAMEACALREVFGDRAETLPLIALGGIVGDCVAGTGGLQAAAAAWALREQTLPACTTALSGKAPMGAPKGFASDVPLGNVLVCSSSLGGQCAALVLQRSA